MGLGWIISNSVDSYPPSFKASLIPHPSSTKAETVAILTALIVSPPQSFVNIFTDSVSVIYNYNNFISHNRYTTRKREKISNYSFWILIKYIILSLNLNITLNKIKSHSGDLYNDKADSLAKSGCNSNILTISPVLHNKLNLSISLNNIPIDSSIRLTWKDINGAQCLSEFIDLNRNKSIKEDSNNNLINWQSTIHFLEDEGDRKSTRLNSSHGSISY